MKSASLNTVKLQNNVYVTKQSNNLHLFFYTNSAQQTQLNVEIYNTNVNHFALFGLNVNSQILKDSILNVTLQFDVLVGALVCLTCDIEIFNSTLIFVGTGNKMSAMIIEMQTSVQLTQTFIQYRITSNNSSGLVNSINSTDLSFQISDCLLTGYDQISSSHNGYICSSIYNDFTLTISKLFICVNQIQRFGDQNSSIINMIGTDQPNCNICAGMNYVYGICSDKLEYGDIINGTIQCVYPFIYFNNQCICTHGYILNDTNCVNVLKTLQNLQDTAGIADLTEIQHNISIIEQKIDDLNISFKSQISAITNFTILEQSILNNFTKSENNLLVNTTVLDWRIYNNISNLNISIDDIDQLIFKQQILIQELVDYIECTKSYGYQIVNGVCVQVTCSIVGQQSINGVCQCMNIHAIIRDGQCVCPTNSQLVERACECNIIANQIINNSQCVCKTQGAIVINNMCACGMGQINVSDICTCPADSTLINGKCACNTIIGQILINGVCQCQSGQQIINGSCQTVYTINNTESTMVCNQVVYMTSFDIITVTNQITSSVNFSNGYVFGSTQYISDAFIDISDSVYPLSVTPLFQVQSSFTNFKLQLGMQQIQGGEMLSSSSQIIISQFNIISRQGSQLTLGSGQLNILQAYSNTANISNLLVNLSFAMSQGNITLINSITGFMNVLNYQVLGIYQCTKIVAMLGINVNIATVFIDKISLSPYIVKTGNLSSLLFCSIISGGLQINNILIVVQNSANQTISSIQSTGTNYYQFGGIVTTICNASKVLINSLIHDSYCNFDTNYVGKSGFLIGHIQDSTSSATITNVCLYQDIISSTLQFKWFGILGWNSGNISIQQAVLTLNIQATYLFDFGIIGLQSPTSIYQEVLNLITSMNTVIQSANSGNYSGIICGALQSENSLISNISVINCNFSLQNNVGGLIGLLYESNGTIQNTTIKQTNISTSGCNVGGFIGYSNKINSSIYNSTICLMNIKGLNVTGGLTGMAWQSKIYISNVHIYQIRITGTSNIGIVLGCNNGQNTFTFTNSSQNSNYINNNMKPECTILSNAFTIIGC
ncbi:Conserved_hypothetical protein [Hexamita inflata]|uniref:Uncharacterized protein n=1 Tax=Hexamita inflata TaxID=28002 RepID=A0AA86NJR9_9EUKA|nr:Conserved hypothetical protein [Hexamita inflata]